MPWQRRDTKGETDAFSPAFTRETAFTRFMLRTLPQNTTRFNHQLFIAASFIY